MAALRGVGVAALLLTGKRLGQYEIVVCGDTLITSRIVCRRFSDLYHKLYLRREPDRGEHGLVS